MTLRSAVSLMRQASYRRGVVDVTLRNPLGPRRSNPLYIFGCSDGWDAAVTPEIAGIGPWPRNRAFT
jgi:hypothetical protein